MKFSKNIILASQSPRRSEILRNAGIPFEVMAKPIEEDFPTDINPALVAEFLAGNKANEFKEIAKNQLVITADTVVICNGQILNKPQDKAEAVKMLTALSGRKHEVITGVCFKSFDDTFSFSDSTQVYFSELSMPEIEFYIENYRPFDKAGAYGVQDFIGMVGIEKIVGSYFNVMGLPIHKIYSHLKPYIEF